jgi:hypothetical protein
MDALTWIETRFERHRAFRYAVIFFAFYAPLTYILGRLAKGKGWLNDFDAFLCGGDYVRRGLSPYDLHPVCEGLNPAPYVYAPQWAQGLAPLIDTFGIMPLKVVYAVIYIAGLALLFWYGLKSAAPRLPKTVRLMAFAILTGSSIQSGNLGIMCHVVILAAALQLERRRWPFVICVVLTSLLKPVLLTYLIVLLLQDRPLRSRLLFAATGAIAGLAGAWLMLKGAGPLGPQWEAMLQALVISDQPGSGFFGWLDWVGLSGSSIVGIALFAIYFIAMIGAGLLIAELATTSARERLILGPGMAALLNPRLMDYDMLGLPLSLALLPVFAIGLPDRVNRLVRNGFVGIYLVCLVLNLLVLKGLKPAPFAILLMAALVLIIATGLWQQNKDRLKSVHDLKLLFFRAG